MFRIAKCKKSLRTKFCEQQTQRVSAIIHVPISNASEVKSNSNITVCAMCEIAFLKTKYAYAKSSYSCKRAYVTYTYMSF